MRLTGKKIIEIVSEYYHVSVDMTISTCRKKEYVKSRQISMYFIKSYFTWLSLYDIGRYYNGRTLTKSHADILYSICRVKYYIETYQDYRKEFQEIEKRLKGIANISEEITPEVIEQQKESILISENKYLKSEIVRLKNEVSKLQGRIFGMKLNKKKNYLKK